MSTIYESIHKSLGREANRPKFPHLSLFYIDDAEGGERARMMEELITSGQVSPAEDGVKVRAETGGWMDGFLGREIWFVDCDGPAESWEGMVLKKIALSGP